MAKRRNKARKIREALAANPSASVRDIIETLKAQRVRVVPAQVYNIKSQMANGAGGAKTKGDQYAALIQAKKLADAMGGIDKARAALDVLAKLV
jgi:hypothetical protein